ncbi:MAG TPA: hypothetical protein VHS05_27540 [Pyrinomonadaceae bacterium]|jgi:hypothetical protein|nr:hypothetical protein [Pyrinomonadaceae bacterium]
MKKTFCLIICFLVALSGATGSGQTSKHGKRKTNYRLIVERKLSGPVTLTSQWWEIEPQEPLKAVRDTQEITLIPSPPIQMVFGRESGDLIPVDGRNADIEAEIIGSDGITYHSRPGRSETMSGDLKITSRSLVFKDLPVTITFNKVRIKSSARYPVSTIYWRCYNWGEIHH